MNLADLLLGYTVTQGAGLEGNRRRAREDEQLTRQRKADDLDMWQMSMQQYRAEEERKARDQSAQRQTQMDNERRVRDRKSDRREERDLISQERYRTAQGEAALALARNRDRAVNGRTPRPRRPLSDGQRRRAQELRDEMSTSPGGTPVTNTGALNRAVFQRLLEEGWIEEDQVPEGATEGERTAPLEAVTRQQRGTVRSYRPENPYR